MASMTEAKAADILAKQRISEIRQLYANVTESNLRNKFKVDWDLSDAVDRYNFHCTEVARYANAITSLAAAQQFLTNPTNRVI
jgi:hypothetical protein